MADLDLDLDNLSDEDKAMFDAMVAEEMRKLEEEFQKQAHVEAAKERYDAPTSPYIPSHQPPPRDYSSHFDGHIVSNRGQQPPPGRQRRDDNSLNPGRLAYKSPDWNNEDEIHVGKGGASMGFGRDESREEKRRKQQEYASQLNDGMVAQKV